MVSLFGRGFDSLQLHKRYAEVNPHHREVFLFFLLPFFHFFLSFVAFLSFFYYFCKQNENR